jgi:hypothetical protein
VLQELKTVFGKIASEKDIEFDLDKKSAERCCINTDETNATDTNQSVVERFQVYQIGKDFFWI